MSSRPRSELRVAQVVALRFAASRPAIGTAHHPCYPLTTRYTLRSLPFPPTCLHRRPRPRPIPSHPIRLAEPGDAEVERLYSALQQEGGAAGGIEAPGDGVDELSTAGGRGGGVPLSSFLAAALGASRVNLRGEHTASLADAFLLIDSDRDGFITEADLERLQQRPDVGGGLLDAEGVHQILSHHADDGGELRMGFEQFRRAVLKQEGDGDALHRLLHTPTLRAVLTLVRSTHRLRISQAQSQSDGMPEEALPPADAPDAMDIT